MFALCALTSLLLLNYIAKQLTHLAGKGLPWTIVAEFLLLSLPFTIAMTLPMAVLVAVLYAFSRLASENEIPAMKANGVSMGRLLIPVAVCSVFFAIVMVAFNDQVLPRTNHRLATLQRDIAQKKPTFTLRERVLNDVLPTRGLALRADRIDRNRSVLYDVHIYDTMSDANFVRTIHADSGHIALTLDQKDLMLTLYRGYVVDVDRKEMGSLNRVYFAVNRMRVEDVGNELRRVEQESVKGDREQSVCEMNDRYQKAYKQTQEEKHRLKARMQEVVAMAVSGSGSMTSSSELPAVGSAVTWGSIYCDGIKALGRHIPALLEERSADSLTGAEGNLIKPRDPKLMSPADSAIAASVAARNREPPAATIQAVAPPASIDGQKPAAANGIDNVPNGETYGGMEVRHFGESISGDIDGARSTLLITERQMDTFAVEIHKKFALAGACIVFVLIGVPFALRFPRGGVGIVIGASLVIFAVSYVGLIAGEGLAKGGKLSPFLAMWGANFLLTIVGAALLVRMGKESMNRGSTLAAMMDDMRNWFARKRLAAKK